jgi:beta-N-acetylhexosaminidase
VEAGLARLRRRDEAPFAAFVEAGGPIVMLSLASFPALDPVPAAFSQRVVEDELRGRLGFDGVTITDELGAEAASAFGSPAQVATAAALAGDDLLLYADWRAARAARETLADGLRSGSLERDGFVQAAARVAALRAGLETGAGRLDSGP